MRGWPISRDPRLHHLKSTVRLRIFGGLRCASFAAGLATLFGALISPFDSLDDQLFSVQTLMCPLIVWILCSAVLWFWHLPGPYGWALESASVHALEHACFFLTSLMFWSLVLQPLGRRRMEYGETLLFVATFGVQNGLLGALLTFAGRPLYVAYLPTTAVWGLTPLEDQQLAGLIMWIPASLIHLTTLGVLFVIWLNAAERQAMLVNTKHPNSVLTHAVRS